ncbi:MAG TPA: discoidin domain-containing protein, partial [Saprospiraceae bacterium]|nr:discoidin domain-containing protein [Saprospiraceae bacterium]
NNYWHVSTIAISVKNNFERRIGIWPAGFDKGGVMYCNTAFGDYPHYLPTGEADHLKSSFTGWMLLNYKKPVTVSSSLSGHPSNNAVDESIRTYWSAASSNTNEWIQSDLGEVCSINAVQINYADQSVDSVFLGKSLNVYHQYKLFYSIDGKKWLMLSDKSQNMNDVPHDYIELKQPVKGRYVRLENVHMPTGYFAISGLRVFGKGNGNAPAPVSDFFVLRTEKDKRNGWIKWNPVDDAYAYNIYYGTASDKLYNCIMVHDMNEYWFKAMDAEKVYYFSIEAINENGVSGMSRTFIAH